jgi:hypothetical protein
MSIYKELTEVGDIKEGIKNKQDQLLDMSKADWNKRKKLLKKLNGLMEELDELEKEMEKEMEFLK